MRHILNTLTHPFRHIRFTTPVATIFGFILLSLSIVAHGVITSNSTPSQPKALFMGKEISDSDIVENKGSSKVTVVVYSDPECPFCISSYPTVKQIEEKYKEKVTFVYRHFPLMQIHPHAFDESKAIHCAQSLGGNEKAKEYIDALYGYKASKQTTQLTPNGKVDLAKNIGLSAQDFTACLEDPASGTAVTTSLNDGVAAGVTGTPTTFVLLKTRKGYEVIGTVEGARPLSYFVAAIEEALAR